MYGNLNLYGRARRLALLKAVIVIVSCFAVILLLIRFIFSGTNIEVITDEYEQLKTYFFDRGFSCESLSLDGGKCIYKSATEERIFYRFSSGFEYSVKTNGYKLYIVHRLDKEDKVQFITTSEAFDGYKNQRFICIHEKNVLDEELSCTSEKDGIELDIASYLGVIEHAQAEITNAVNSSGFSLDGLLVNYEWTKK